MLNDYPKVRILCMPDIDKAIGGVKQLYRHAEHLTSIGLDAAIVTQNEGFRPAWFESNAVTKSFLSCIESGDFDSTNCILVVPETYIGTDFSDFYGHDLGEFYRVIFNQNAYYSYGKFALSQGDEVYSFYSNPLVLQVLSVSNDTHKFLIDNMGIKDNMLSRIINAIEPIFDYQHTQKEQSIHWMPRKNPDHVGAILHGLKYGGLKDSEGWSGTPLSNLSHSEVANALNLSKLFLSFGHPEGFGLPIAEAMASGCWVVGYSGGGGNELFGFGASLQVNYGDWTEFVHKIQFVLSSYKDRPREMYRMARQQSEAIKRLYSKECEFQSVKDAWENVLEEFNSRKNLSL